MIVSITLFPLHISCSVVSCYVSSRGGGNTSDSSVKTERVQEQKEKMQVELQALWTEQCDQLRKKKEQCATEVREIQVYFLLALQFPSALQSVSVFFSPLFSVLRPTK